jgi:hypothetical protein
MLRTIVARKLRILAHKIDRRFTLDMSWHQANTAAMNRYIDSTEKYVFALETIVTSGHPSLTKEELLRLRSQHKRLEPRWNEDPDYLEC